MQFLDFTGEYKIINNNLFKFKFGGSVETPDVPTFVLPPIYDISFNKILTYNNIGLEIIRDFLNSILFPKSQSIIELKYLQSNVSSNSHLKQNEENDIVDNACIAKIKYIEKDRRTFKEKEILIYFEMMSDYQVHKFSNKFLNDSKENTERNNVKEKWVIILYVDRLNKTINEDSDKYFTTKKYKLNEDNLDKDLNHIPIIEIYLNDLYSKLNEPISIFENEEIQDIGKEWIKFFAIELWAYSIKKPYYCIPSNIQFKGKYIKKAIEALSDIFDVISLRINVEKHHQKEIYEDTQRRMNQSYKNGLNYANLKILDIYFEQYTHGEKLEKIILVEKISPSLLKERYGESQNVQNFLQLLSSNNLIMK